MNSKLTPVTCNNCGDTLLLIDTIEGACLECALDGAKRNRTKSYVLVARKWLDDSVYIVSKCVKPYKAFKGGN